MFIIMACPYNKHTYLLTYCKVKGHYTLYICQPKNYKVKGHYTLYICQPAYFISWNRFQEIESYIYTKKRIQILFSKI